MAEIGANSFQGLNALQGPTTGSRTSQPNDMAAALLQLLTQRQVPARMQGWKAALSALSERAAASPRAMEGLVSPQLTQMAQQILAKNAEISRGFGPFGGKQTAQALGASRAGLDLPGLYANAAIKSGQDLSQFLEKTTMATPSGQTSTETRQEPIDLANIAKQWEGLLRSGSSLYGGIRDLSSASRFGMSPTTYRAVQGELQQNLINSPELFGAPAIPQVSTSGFGRTGGGGFGGF